MDENKEINEYLEKLPKPVQDFVLSNVWLDKSNEIAKKYSLNPEQTESLSNAVLLVLTMVIDPKDFNKILVEDLGVSELLTEQLVGEIETRIFDFAIKQIESKTSPTKPSSTQNNDTPLNLKNELEVRPNNFPSTTLNIPKEMIKPAFQNPVLDKQKSTLSPDIGVPRYATGNSSSSPQINPVVNKVNIVDNKLNNTTGGSPSAASKYERDPYREPLV